jgi:hypothetical protein
MKNEGHKGGRPSSAKPLPGELELETETETETETGAENYFPGDVDKTDTDTIIYLAPNISKIKGYAGIDMSIRFVMLFKHKKGGLDFRLDVWGNVSEYDVAARRGINLEDYIVKELPSDSRFAERAAWRR